MDAPWQPGRRDVISGHTKRRSRKALESKDFRAFFVGITIVSVPVQRVRVMKKMHSYQSSDLNKEIQADRPQRASLSWAGNADTSVNHSTKTMARQICLLAKMHIDRGGGAQG